LLDLPSDQYRVFSGIAPLNMGFEAHAALVHADGNTPDLAELVQEMAERTDAGFLFGGLTSSRSKSLQFALSGDGTISGHGASSGDFGGGLSGVAFGPNVGLVSRVTQGCKPVSPARTITSADHNVIVTLDGEPALDVLMRDDVTMDQPQQTLDAIRATLVGLTSADGTPVHQTGTAMTYGCATSSASTLRAVEWRWLTKWQKVCAWPFANATRRQPALI
jgi:small ligand-binding sensory domain FIST